MTPEEKADLIDRIYEKQEHEITQWRREFSCKDMMISSVFILDGIEYTVIYSVDDNQGVLIKTDTAARTVAESHNDLLLDSELIAKIAELHALHLRTKGQKQ